MLPAGITTLAGGRATGLSVASVTVSNLPFGSSDISATYSGSSTYFDSASASLAQLVNAADIDKDLVVRFKFSAERYAKKAGPMLLVRPRVVGEMAGPWDANKPRHYAYDFRAPFLNRDSVEISLPEGFTVYELPEAAKASFPFADYSSKTEMAGNLLKYTREYKMNATQVPFESMEQLKKLFAEINSDEKSMAVLKKAN